MAKRVWRRERDLTGWMSLSRKPEMTWYGWDGDRLTTVQTDTTRIQTVYQPGSFAPLIRIETDNGDLVRISGPRQTREYGDSATGRLESVRTLAPDLDIRIPYATDPAGNRLPDPELHPDSTLTVWPDNRIAKDAHYVYHYDEYGRLTE